MSEATFAPFRALRFQAANVDRLGDVWAPPYDVVTPGEAESLRARSPYNVVRLILPEGATPERYDRAAAILRSWIADCVLEQDPLPAFYVHQHRFVRDGESFVRTGVWGLLRLEPFDAGVVLPHERTLSEPKADRLSLMRACRAQLSPVFMICSDLDDAIRGLLEARARAEPTETAEFPAGEEHRIWRATDARLIGELSAALRDQVLLIADGHHRYETALAYRDELVAINGAHTGRGSHEYVLAYIVPERDPGLLLLPTHRAIGGEPLDWAAALESAADRFEVRRIDDSALAVSTTLMATDAGGPAFVLALHGEPGGWVLQQREPERFGGFAAVALHDVFLREVLGLSAEEQLERTSYFRDAEDALGRLESGEAQAVALLAAPSVAQVREAARARIRLPPKTTYFTPKVPSGVAIHVVDPTEEVEAVGTT